MLILASYLQCDGLVSRLKLCIGPQKRRNRDWEVLLAEPCQPRRTVVLQRYFRSSITSGAVCGQSSTASPAPRRIPDIGRRLRLLPTCKAGWKYHGTKQSHMHSKPEPINANKLPTPPCVCRLRLVVRQSQSSRLCPWSRKTTPYPDRQRLQKISDQSATPTHPCPLRCDPTFDAPQHHTRPLIPHLTNPNIERPQVRHVLSQISQIKMREAAPYPVCHTQGTANRPRRGVVMIASANIEVRPR